MNFKEYLDPDNGYALLKQAGNMPLASHWIEVPESAECFIRMRTGIKPGSEFFFKDIDGDYMLWRDPNWIEASYDCAQEYIDEGDELLWSREQAQEQGLISGADAKLAWANGQDVQCSFKKHKDENTWFLLLGNDPLSTFDRDDILFRIKPRTIKLELEIPAPFEPKLGEIYYFITTSNSQGFDFTEFEASDGDKLYMQLGAYKTASDAQKAVAALRGGIKG